MRNLKMRKDAHTLAPHRKLGDRFVRAVGDAVGMMALVGAGTFIVLCLLGFAEP